MIACVVPFVSEDSKALTGNSNLSLDTSSVVLYVDTSSSPNSYTFTVSGVPTDQTSNVAWRLNDLDDGTSIVTLSSSGTSATVTAASVGTVEIEAYVTGTTDYYASAVIVVFQNQGKAADEFHFYFQIDSDAYAYLLNNSTISSTTLILPSGRTLSDFNTGFWVTVTQTQTGYTDSEFNALTAVKWYFAQNGWNNDIGSYGWISTLLGLGTYEGETVTDEDGNESTTYYYWAQYHGTNSGWAFNNTTLQYITTQEYEFIGLIFWGSPNADTMPAWPGYNIN